MTIFLFLTALIWIAIFIIGYHIVYRYQIGISLREVFLIAAMMLGLLIVLSTEGLSLFTLLTPAAIKITWLLAFIISVGLAIYLILHRKESLISLGAEIHDRYISLKSQSWRIYLILSLIAISLIATLITIQLNPVPNNGDSMRYHLVRTLVWEQQASVRHFATHTLQQITFPPFAEYALMHVNMLVGNDSLSRIVQWIAMLICIVGVSEIARKLGADLPQQLSTALLCVTIPMVIIQSTSTMNDLVVAAWLVCFISFGFRFERQPINMFNSVVTGLALGLALITKSTAFILALPFSIWVAVRVFRREGFRLHVWKVGAVITMLILLINGGHFTRNMLTFGSPLGQDIGTVNEVFSLRVLASNVIRNIQMHMLASGDQNPEILNLLSRGIRNISFYLHSLTGLDPQDPRTTFVGKYLGFDNPGGINTAEGKAGAFVHLVLILITIILSTFLKKKSDLNQYVYVLIATFLLFSFLLKAQTPMNRLLTPYLVIWTPAIALTIPPNKSRPKLMIFAIVWVLSLPWLLNAKYRPLLLNTEGSAAAWTSNNVEVYFFRKPLRLPIYEEAAEIIVANHCSEIGIIYLSEYDSFFEYPFWMMLEEKGFTGTIQHILVQNESAIYSDPQFSPCIIFSNTVLENPVGYSLYKEIQGDKNNSEFLIYSEN